eukprot:COSAG01_NODE_4_length_55812_cov_1344.168109_49_plen_375_part_00
MTLLKLISSTILPWGICYFLIPIQQKLAAKLKLLDTPAPRKLHQKNMPTSGGISLFISLTPLFFLATQANPSYWGLLLGASLLVGTGILDDRHPLSPKIKLLSQCTAAIIAIQFGNNIEWLSNPLGGIIYLGTLSKALTFCWIIGVINAFNLIDGIDGLAAGIACIASLAMTIIAFKMQNLHTAMLSLALTSSCLAFLKYNRYPAKIFMGDSGSMLIGFVLAYLSITGVLKSSLSLSVFSPLLILALPLSDTIYTIFRRLKNKNKLFTADKKHLHHQLLNLGYSIPKITMGLCCISALLSGLAILINLPKNLMIYSSLSYMIIIAVAAKPILNYLKNDQLSIKRVLPKTPANKTRVSKLHSLTSSSVTECTKAK